MSRLRCLLAAGLVLSSSPASALPARGSVPLSTVEFSGHRYVVPVDLGRGIVAPLMIHGNSRLYLSVTHQVGARLNGGPVRKVEGYGYSSRGKGYVRVERIGIEGESFPGDIKTPVFDFAEDRDTPVQGMLGVPFLIAAQAAVDFTSDRLLLGVSRQARPDRALLTKGYRCVPFTVDADHRTTIQVRFPALRRTLPITPSTVSSALTLHLPLFQGRIPMSKGSKDRSPNGTTPDEFHSDRVAYEIAGARMSSPASFEDFAEYGKVQEKELETYGMLGYDWMKEHRAVIDYANLKLYFKP